MISIKDLTDFYVGALAADAAIEAWCQAEYGKAATVFVGIDEQRRALPCATWTPVTDEDRALDAHAVELVAIRDRFGN